MKKILAIIILFTLFSCSKAKTPNNPDYTTSPINSPEIKKENFTIEKYKLMNELYGSFIGETDGTQVTIEFFTFRDILYAELVYGNKENNTQGTYYLEMEILKKIDDHNYIVSSHQYTNMAGAGGFIGDKVNNKLTLENDTLSIIPDEPDGQHFINFKRKADYITAFDYTKFNLLDDNEESMNALNLYGTWVFDYGVMIIYGQNDIWYRSFADENSLKVIKGAYLIDADNQFNFIGNDIGYFKLPINFISDYYLENDYLTFNFNNEGYMNFTKLKSELKEGYYGRWIDNETVVFIYIYQEDGVNYFDLNTAYSLSSEMNYDGEIAYFGDEFYRLYDFDGNDIFAMISDEGKITLIGYPYNEEFNGEYYYSKDFEGLTKYKK